MSLLCYGEVCDFFTFRPSDLITTLTYVLNYGQLLSLFVFILAPYLFPKKDQKIRI